MDPCCGRKWKEIRLTWRSQLFPSLPSPWRDGASRKPGRPRRLRPSVFWRRDIPRWSRLDPVAPRKWQAGERALPPHADRRARFWVGRRGLPPGPCSCPDRTKVRSAGFHPDKPSSPSRRGTLPGEAEPWAVHPRVPGLLLRGDSPPLWPSPGWWAPLPARFRNQDGSRPGSSGASLYYHPDTLLLRRDLSDFAPSPETPHIEK